MSFSAAALAHDTITRSCFRESTGKHGKGSRLASRALKFIAPHDWDVHIRPTILQDFSDPAYVQKSAELILDDLAPGYGSTESLEFTIAGPSEEFRVATNIDFDAANRILHRTIPPEVTSLSPAYILAKIADVPVDVLSAAGFNAELVTDSLNSKLIQLKMESVVQRRRRSEEQLQLFQQYTLEDGRAISEAINRNPARFDEFTEILEKSRRFRSFVHGVQRSDPNLLGEYFKEVTKETWIERLPSKAVRWCIATGLGFLFGGPVGAAAGAGASAVDTFLIDRLSQGWKPNQFVDKDLRSFVERDR